MLLTVLMIEVEQPEGLSARKLVLESCKHNVITAYNGEIGVELFKRFPNVDAVVVHVDVRSIPFSEVVRQIREVRPDVPIIALSPIPNLAFEGVDHVVPSHDPQAILRLLAGNFRASISN